MERFSRHGLIGLSRRDFIASGSALLAMAAGAPICEAADNPGLQRADGSPLTPDGNNAIRNVLFRGNMGSRTVQLHPWRADWITSPEAPAKEECILHFRKAFELSTTPSRFIIHVSADNQYLLRVNGRYVGVGPSHSGIQHWKYTTYDIAGFLHSGRNLISATVWSFGGHAPLRQITYQIGFLVDGDPGNSIDIRTDKSWRVAVEKGISTLPPPVFPKRYYYAASPGEKLDAKVFRWDWDAPDADVNEDNGWFPSTSIGHASIRGTASLQTHWQLVPDDLPLMDRLETPAGKVVRVSGLESCDHFPERAFTVPPGRHVSVLIDVGHFTTGYPELKVSKGRGSQVRLTYAGALYRADGRKGNRNNIKNKYIAGLSDEFYPDGDFDRSFSPLGWRAWRYLQIDVVTDNEALDVKGLRNWFTAYPFVRSARLDTRDSMLESIMNVGWRTAQLCAHDTYMDCPYWERLQYVGDTRIQALISYVMTGDDRLARQAIQAFHNSAIPDGITLSRYPSSLFQVIPGYSLFWVGMVHDFWMYNDDREFVRRYLPLIRSTLSWFAARLNPNGLLGKLPWWSFVDWSNGFHRGVPPEEGTGNSSILSLQFVEALRYAAKLENALGLKEMAHLDTEQADLISTAVWKQCWSSKYELLADTPEKRHFSQHANAFGVWLNIVPRREQKAVMNKILSVNNPGFPAKNIPPRMSLASYYFRFYLARALVHAGMGDRYLDILGPWRKMLSEGLTTWAETPPPTRSDCHAWSAHPNYDLLTTVAGISPSACGFRRVQIMPHLGHLKYLKATMPTPRGVVTLEIDLKSSKRYAAISLPPGLDGAFVWEQKHYRLSSGKRRLAL